MLWLPSTPGEELFLYLYEHLGHKIGLHLNGQQSSDAFDFLYDSGRFQEFTRLSVSLEIFLRALRTARLKFSQIDDDPQNFAKDIRRELDLPAFFSTDRTFGEIVKRAGRVAHQKTRDDQVEKSVLKAERKQCYLCGIALDTKNQNHTKSTIEHIWPLSLGGATTPDNLIPACKDCNDKRQHTITWAWGPVQSTYEELGHRDNINGQIRLSLGLGRIVLRAAGNGRSNTKMTLKQAAESVWPAVPILNLKKDRAYVYFELFREMERTI